MVWSWTDTIIQGLLLGGLYAIFATGLSIVFGIMRIINIAHGDFIILGSFIALALVEWTGIGPMWSLVIVAPVMALIGYVLQRGILNQTLGTDLMPPLLVTFGLSVIIQNGLLQIFSANSRGLSMGSFETASLIVGPLSIGLFPLVILASAVVILVGLQVFFSRSATGRAFRATSDNLEVAGLMGVDNRHMYGLAMALAMAIIAVAGVFLAIKTTFTPLDGPTQLLIAFEAVVIGGLGSLWGTLAGGILLGVAQVIGFRINPGWGVLAGHLVFLAVLVMRPEGLFPRTRD